MNVIDTEAYENALHLARVYFKPQLHPRDYLGRFIEKPKGVTEAKRFQQYANKAQIAVRVGTKELKGILRDGRFKTGHEEGVYGKGFYPPERVPLEDELFGGSRPVYGYLTDDNEDFDELDDSIGPYGPVKVILKDEVRKRTTVTLEDSMVAPDIKPALVDRITDEAAEGWDHKQTVPYPGYTEAQIHGSPRASEIKEIVFGHGPPDTELEGLLAEWGIPWRVDPDWRRNKENALYDEDGNMV